MSKCSMVFCPRLDFVTPRPVNLAAAHALRMILHKLRNVDFPCAASHFHTSASIDDLAQDIERISSLW